MPVLIYSGDVDGCVPTWGTETLFLRTLGMDITTPWAPWGTVAENGNWCKAGYHEMFGGTAQGIDFVTFNGAGHMVPLYKPAEMFTILSRCAPSPDMTVDCSSWLFAVPFTVSLDVCLAPHDCSILRMGV